MTENIAKPSFIQLNRPKSRSRATSAGPLSRETNSTNLWPPSYLPAYRSLTPAPEGNNFNNSDKKILRPKTTGGRLRSKVAEQILNEQRSIIHFEELNYNRKDKI